MEERAAPAAQARGRARGATPGAGLRITEIFLSLQGEASRVGLPTVFVRLTGCPLRCSWCDTAYAFHGGQRQDVSAVLEKVQSFRVPRVCVTGGEPLAQKASFELMKRLCDLGLDVCVETSGALDVSKVDPRVSRIVDVKAPGSGEVARNHWDNLAVLTARDEVKFVLANRRDYDWACGIIREHDLPQRCGVLFSPVHGVLAPRDLADWIVADRLPVRFQLQIHKQLWGDVPGR